MTPKTSKLLEFYYALYLDGVPLEPSKMELLIKNGLVKSEEQQAPYREPLKRNGRVITPIISSNLHFFEEGVLVTERESGNVVFDGRKDIKREEWLPKSKIEHQNDFINWVNSFPKVNWADEDIEGFVKLPHYEKFFLYCQQADNWILEKRTENDADDLEEWEDREADRCHENTLYFMDAYFMVKDSEEEGGAVFKYHSTLSHRVLIYLYDCGYNIYFAKPRQIAATTTIMGCALKSLLLRRNFFSKFVTENEAKGIEIFRDKCQYPFTELPTYLKTKIQSFAANTFGFGYGKKGEKEGANSRMEVIAPSPTVISGGSPSEILIDEAGNIGILSKIIKDGMPTLFRKDVKTKKIEMKRRFIAWGTGGDMEKGGKAFEGEYMATLRKWNEGKNQFGIIPLFFNWTSRPGVDQAFYDAMKEEFYSTEGSERDAARIKFHQQYPTTIEDVFLSSAQTLVDMSYINDQLARITKEKQKSYWGFFEPKFGDIEMPEGSDVPYNIIGANFIPTEDNDHRATVQIFMQPQKGWLNRYYQGTDPIAADSGLSNMASGIWDRRFNTIAAMLDFRDRNVNYLYLQTLLLGLYYSYDGLTPCPELIESNIGKAYINYKTAKGTKYERSMILNTELPDAYRMASSTSVGIDTKEIRKRLVVNEMQAIIQAYGDRIYIDTWWTQLKTFASKITENGKQVWAPIDRKIHRDDTLFGGTFSYICSRCFEHLQCKSGETEKKRTVVKTKLVYNKDWQLTRVAVKVKQ